MQAFRGAVLYGDPDVGERLDTVQAAIACHGASTDVLARMAFLAGVAASDGDDTARVTEWFRTARTWMPSMEYDRDFPSALAPLFTDASPPTETFTLAVVPGGAVQIDGGAADKVTPAAKED